MVTGIERLRAAGDLLRRNGADPPDRTLVLSATAEVWEAVTAGLDEWPWELQARAVPVQFHLVRHGSPTVTIRRMTTAELDELRQELLAFVEAAERLDGSMATGGISGMG